MTAIDDVRKQIDGEQQEKKLKIPPRQIAYDLCSQNIERIFRDQDGDLYVVCNIGKRKDILNVDSKEFEAFCRRLYEEDYISTERVAEKLDEMQDRIDEIKSQGGNYHALLTEKIDLAEYFKDLRKHDKVLSGSEYNNAKEQIHSTWYNNKETRYVGKRVIWDKINNFCYYNLANNNGDIVKIWPDKEGRGWSIISNTELLLFAKLKPENEQVAPASVLDLSRRYTEDEIMAGLNFKNPRHRLITEVYVISLYLDGIPHPVFLPNAPERAGKSTIQGKIKSLADPREVEMLSYEKRAESNISKISMDPRNEWNRALEWESNWVTFADNVSYMPASVMDEVCSLVQGGFRISKKKNYTDKEQSIISITRPVGFNSITNFMSIRPDANIRTFAPEFLSRAKFVDTEELWKKFYTNKPATLGYIFGILSKFLDLYPRIYHEIVPMAGDGLTSFEKVGEAISRCLGNKAGEFQTAWAEYYAERLDSSIQQNTLAQLVIVYVNEEGKKDFAEQPTVVYNKLKELATRHGYELKDDHSFPAHQNTLTPALKRIENILRSQRIEIDTNGGKEQGKRVIRFCNKNYPDSDDKEDTNESDGPPSDGSSNQQESPVKVEDRRAVPLKCPICKKFEHYDSQGIEHHVIYTHGKNDMAFLRGMKAEMKDDEVFDQLLIAFPGRYSEDTARKIVKTFTANL